jgi:NAD dependent epimerase/dehydratase family enzyme
MSTIGLIGCGWLGKPLAKSLSREHQVECFTRKAQEENGLEYILNPECHHPFWEKEIFIIAISTRGDYLSTLEAIAQKCSASASLILMSSTSVYKEFECEVNEETLITQKSTPVQAEELMLALRKKVLILRLGGLMGEDRISGRWKSVSRFTDGPVNYIHQDDAISIVQMMLKKNVNEGIYNLVAPKHPLRSQVYLNNSKTFGFKPGKLEGTSKRIVSSAKLINELEYAFIHPDPLAFWTSNS